MVTPRSTATWPSAGWSSPVIIRNSVVLPAPFGRPRPAFSPFWSAADASMKRIWWPCCLLTLSRRIIGALALEIAAALLFDVARCWKSHGLRNNRLLPIPLEPSARGLQPRNHDIGRKSRRGRGDHCRGRKTAAERRGFFALAATPASRYAGGPADG